MDSYYSINFHRAQLSKLSKLSKGKKGKSSSSAAAKNRAKSSSTSTSAAAAGEPVPSTSDLAAASEDKFQPQDIIKTEVKSEVAVVLDSASQPALGGYGDHWKCNQCKVVFETGPELLDHLDQIKQVRNFNNENYRVTNQIRIQVGLT